jgi:hypothetical protein
LSRALIHRPLSGPDGPPNGFIAYLTKTHKGNLYEPPVVTVHSSWTSAGDTIGSPHHILDFEPTRSFVSENSPYQWVSWTFHVRHVVVVHHSSTQSCQMGCSRGCSRVQWTRGTGPYLIGGRTSVTLRRA